MKRKIAFAALGMLVLMATGSLYAAGTEEAAEPSAQPLIWYVPGGAGYPYNELEEAAVYAAFNEILRNELDLEVEIRVQGKFGEYKEKMPLILASGEKMDLLWTASWSNDFLKNAYDGFYAGLDDLLEKHGRDILRDTRSQLEATRVEGQIRAVWSQQIAVYNSQVTVNMDLVEKYGWDMNAIETLEDLEPILDEALAKEPELTPFGLATSPFGLIWPYYGVQTITGNVGVYADDPEMKVFNVIESPEYREWCELMYKWNQAGYVSQDGLTYTDDQWRQLKDQARFVMFHHNTYNPQNAEIVRAGSLYKAFRIGGGYTITGNIINTLQAVHSQSERQEDAVRFLNFLWTNKDAYNILVWGLEDKHYEKTGPNRITPIQDSGYYTNIPWMWGNTFQSLLLSHQPDSLFDEVRELNANSKKVPLLGFNPRIDDVKTLLASVSAVQDQYDTQVSGGYIDPAIGIPQYVEALKRAGIDELAARMQAQIDAWAASNK